VRLAATTAVTSVERSLTDCASCTMFMSLVRTVVGAAAQTAASAKNARKTICWASEKQAQPLGRLAVAVNLKTHGADLTQALAADVYFIFTRMPTVRRIARPLLRSEPPLSLRTARRHGGDGATP
jgi:hypothetical protein